MTKTRARDDGDENGEDEDEGATSSMTKTRTRDVGDENGEDALRGDKGRRVR